MTELFDATADRYDGAENRQWEWFIGEEIHMLWTISAVLIILWILGLGAGFSMGSSIHILFAAAVALLVVSISQEAMITEKLRRVLRSQSPKPYQRRKRLQPSVSLQTYREGQPNSIGHHEILGTVAAGGNGDVIASIMKEQSEKGGNYND